MSDTIISIKDASIRFNLAMQKDWNLKDHVDKLFH